MRVGIGWAHMAGTPATAAHVSMRGMSVPRRCLKRQALALGYYCEPVAPIMKIGSSYTLVGVQLPVRYASQVSSSVSEIHTFMV